MSSDDSSLRAWGGAGAAPSSQHGASAALLQALNSLRQRAARAVDQAIVRMYGLSYSVRHYYSPVASKRDILKKDLDRKPLPGTDQVLSRHDPFACLADLAPFVEEAQALPEYQAVFEKGLGLGYGEIEGLVLYAMIRLHKPDFVLEIGGGVSSFYAVEALKVNGSGRLIVVEPYPSVEMREYLALEGVTLHDVPLQDIDIEGLMADLTSDSFVLVDSTHVLRADSELSIILLSILPRIRPGARVQFHDIYYPYPVIFREHNMFDASHAWNETLALAIALQCDDKLYVEAPLYWWTRHHFEHFSRVFTRLQTTLQYGSSLWIRRRPVR